MPDRINAENLHSFLRDLQISTAPLFDELLRIDALKETRITFICPGDVRFERVAPPHVAQLEAQILELIESIRVSRAKAHGIHIEK